MPATLHPPVKPACTQLLSSQKCKCAVQAPPDLHVARRCRGGEPNGVDFCAGYETPPGHRSQHGHAGPSSTSVSVSHCHFRRNGSHWNRLSDRWSRQPACLWQQVRQVRPVRNAGGACIACAASSELVWSRGTVSSLHTGPSCCRRAAAAIVAADSRQAGNPGRDQSSPTAAAPLTTADRWMRRERSPRREDSEPNAVRASIRATSDRIADSD